MKQNKENGNLIMVSLGAVLLALRLRLYLVAVDEKNLIVSGHPLSWAIWAVTALCFGLALTKALKNGEEKTLTVSSPVAALGTGLFALAICLNMIGMEPQPNLLGKLCMAFGWLSVPALGYGAYCQARGKEVFFGSFCVVCVFFALYLVCSYQLWSRNPQLQDYAFTMLASVMATLFAYQNAALALGSGSKRMWRATGMLAISFGIAAVREGFPQMLLHLAIAGWALTTMLGACATDKEEN